MVIGGEETLKTLTRPANCPPELFHIMSECWHQEPAQRPRFSDIHNFFQRNKNPAYSPGLTLWSPEEQQSFFKNRLSKKAPGC